MGLHLPTDSLKSYLGIIKKSCTTAIVIAHLSQQLSGKNG